MSDSTDILFEIKEQLLQGEMTIEEAAILMAHDGWTSEPDIEWTKQFFRLEE